MKKIILAFIALKMLVINGLFSQMSLSEVNIPKDSIKSETRNPKSEIDTPLSINALNSPFSSSIFEKQAVEPNKMTDLLTPSATFNRRRFAALVGTGTTAYVGAIALLQNLWYAQYPRSSFHRFNDDGEWLQMDKVGHIISAYHGSRWTYGAMRWTGMKNRNAAWFGMAVGTAFQATIEVLWPS